MLLEAKQREKMLEVIVNQKSSTAQIEELLHVSGQIITELEKQREIFARSGLTLPLSMVNDLCQLAANLREVKRTVADQEREHNQLFALVDVGRVINSSLDHTTVLNEVMDTIITLTGAERGFMMLKNGSGELDFHIARNMANETLDETDFKISRTIVSQVAKSGEAVLTTNAMQDQRFENHKSVMIYNLRSILCVPLIVKGVVTGVIYADNRVRSGLFTKQDLNILKAFANQAAVAIENARLFNGLQNSNIELAKAYDITLEGWARALELRDKETEGHTRRVTNLTVCLAKEMGFDEGEIINIRRGALLHDIGKMGIPDRILLKPGPLTSEERLVMEKHPVYAYDMLVAVEKLRPALDIPYRHHEKWDGTGYPGRLKGNEIPLPARIFSIVDVWDALRSNRPYREAWPMEKVWDYIHEQAGKHFDPQVVGAFKNIPRSLLE